MTEQPELDMWVKLYQIRSDELLEVYQTLDTEEKGKILCTLEAMCQIENTQRGNPQSLRNRPRNYLTQASIAEIRDPDRRTQIIRLLDSQLDAAQITRIIRPGTYDELSAELGIKTGTFRNTVACLKRGTDTGHMGGFAGVKIINYLLDHGYQVSED